MTTPDEIAHEIALDNEAIARCNQCVQGVEELKAHVDDLDNKTAERRKMNRTVRKAAKKVRAESLAMLMKDKERAEERSAMRREMQKKDEPKKESTRSGSRKGFL